MNPIKCLWDVLKDKIHEVSVNNKTQLTKRLICVWFHSEKIKVLCVSLINSMPSRVAALKQAKGGQTKYQAVCFFSFYEHLSTKRVFKCY